MVSNYDMINHVHLHWRRQTRAGDYAQARQHIERGLSELDLQPDAMPPNAVLLIRKIQGLPALNDLTALPANWRQELHQLVTWYYDHAVRISKNGYIPPDAESVLFLDYAEALAGLTVAVIERRFQNDWYWSQILPAGYFTNTGVLAVAWSRYITYLPASFTLLNTSQILAAVQMLSPQEVSWVIRELNTTYGLPDFERLRQANTGVTETAEDSRQGRVQSRRTMPDIVAPPWDAWLPTRPYTLPVSTQYLVGLTLTLAHAPTYARSESFANSVAQWVASSDQIKAQHTLSPKRDKRIVQRDATSSSTDNINESQSDIQKTESYTPEAQSLRRQSDDTPTENRTHADGSPGDSTDSTDRTPSESDTTEHAVDDTETFSATITEDGIWTQLGGVFYLINIMSWLGLPQAWDNILTEHLSAWSLLELLARGLLSDEVNFDDDAIWEILATLDERELDTAIGADFPPQAEFFLPVGVFRRFAPTDVHWQVSVADDILQIRDNTYHYVIMEMPLDGQDVENLVDEVVAEYRTDAIHITWAFTDDLPEIPIHNLVGVSPSLQFWLSRVLVFVRYCLEAVAEIQPLDMLQIQSQIFITFTHIDVYLPLNRVDLQVRKTGLDRNPGWSPDFGYIILFHFYEG